MPQTEDLPLGRNAGWLKSITHLLIDMDGVLFRGRTPIPRASPFVKWLEMRDLSYRLLTNNSTRTPERNAEALAAMGFDVRPDQIFTSSLATAGYLKQEGAEGQNVFVVGEDGLLQALSAIGVTITKTPSEAAWVVAGLDRRVTYAKLRDAAFAVQNGARFVATNSDANLPVEEGLVPGAGSLQAVITLTTNVRPVVIGKPEALMLELGAAAIGGDRTNTAMLGDRLDTDIEAARRAGMKSILVLTGVSTEADLDNNPAAPPDLVVRDLPHLQELWGG